ncbi:hypothetical protein MTO96_047858 [Rhipicephalus appendiculatus]
MYIFGGTKRFHQRCTFDVPKAQPKRRHVACCGVSSERIPLRLPLPTGNAGGLCEKFQSDVALQLTSDYTGRVSLNTGIVTFVNKNVRVPHRISEVTFAHELGHSFGAQFHRLKPVSRLERCKPITTRESGLLMKSDFLQRDSH